MSLQDEIADEYLPDINVNGMDCPDTESAKEIISKVLDAAVQAAIVELNELDCIYGETQDIVDAINALRPKS